LWGFVLLLISPRREGAKHAKEKKGWIRRIKQERRSLLLFFSWRPLRSLRLGEKKWEFRQIFFEDSGESCVCVCSKNRAKLGVLGKIIGIYARFLHTNIMPCFWEKVKGDFHTGARGGREQSRPLCPSLHSLWRPRRPGTSSNHCLPLSILSSGYTSFSDFG